MSIQVSISNDRPLDVSGLSHKASIFACFKSQLESSQVGNGNEAKSHKQSPCVAPSARQESNSREHYVAPSYEVQTQLHGRGRWVSSAKQTGFQKTTHRRHTQFEEQVQVTQKGFNRRPGPSQAFRTRGTQERNLETALLCRF